MKISTLEGYGLRILLSIARNANESGLSINEISNVEGISNHNVAKTLRELRLTGYVESERGQNGGYFLARPANEIYVANVLSDLGGRLFDESEEVKLEVLGKLCTDSTDCSLRSLWTVVQHSVDNVLADVSLNDLLGSGDEFKQLISTKIDLETFNN